MNFFLHVVAQFLLKLGVSSYTGHKNSSHDRFKYTSFNGFLQRSCNYIFNKNMHLEESKIKICLIYIFFLPEKSKICILKRIIKQMFISV